MDEIAGRELIKALYHTLLRRDPEEAGISAYVQELMDNKRTIASAIEHMLRSNEFAEKLGDFCQHYINGADLKFLNSVSQNGEIDYLIREIVNTTAVNRIVVDVGARGRDRSNSYDLLRHFGWRGVLIEGNPNLIPTITDDFAGLSFELLNYAVSDYTGEADFHFGINDDVSSLSKPLAEAWGETKGASRVKVDRIGNLLSLAKVPLKFDLMSVDIEGEDIKVTNDLVDTSKYRPRWIIIEVPPVAEIKSLADLPFSTRVRNEYKLHGQIGPNLVLKSVSV